MSCRLHFLAKPRNQPRFASTVRGRTLRGEFRWNSVFRVDQTAPGVASRQVLEMSNVAGRPLAIRAGVRVCQIVLQRCEGSAVYAGRFAHQEAL